jgi:hypothetical protein
MREREGPAAPLGVDIHLGVPKGLHTYADLHIPQLSDEVVTLIADALTPPEEHVAGRLCEPIAVHDALSVVGKLARAGVRLQHRGTRLLELEEEGIVLAGPAALDTDPGTWRGSQIRCHGKSRPANRR